MHKIPSYFFFAMISTQGGVFPLCAQGSKVVYKVAPEQFFNLLKALNSECGLPFFEVTPKK